MHIMPLYGYEIKESLGNILKIHSEDQVNHLHVPILAFVTRRKAVSLAPIGSQCPSMITTADNILIIFYGLCESLEIFENGLETHFTYRISFRTKRSAFGQICFYFPTGRISNDTNIV